MQEIHITPDLLQAIRLGRANPTRAVTTTKITQDGAFLSCDGVRLPLVEMSVQEKKISELDTSDIFPTRVGREISDVLDFLEETGQTAVAEDTVYLIDWDRLVPDKDRVVGYRPSSRTVEDADIIEDRPHISLSKMLTPLAKAQDGDVVALSFPFMKDFMTMADDLADEDRFYVLVKQGKELVAQSPDQCSDDLQARYFAWLQYGFNENDWNIALGVRACEQLHTYIDRGAKCTAYFFTDFVVGATTSDLKLLAVSIPSNSSEVSGNMTDSQEAIADYLANWTAWTP